MILATIIIFLLVFGFLALIIPIQHVANLRTIKMMAKIQGPKGLPLIGLGFEISTLKTSDILDYLSNLCKEFPRLFKLWIAGLPFVILQEPEDLEVAMGSVAHIEKGLEYNPLLPWLQEGLLVSKGNKWRRRRKLLTPTFHFKILENNLPSLNQHSRILVKNLLEKDGEPIAIKKLINLCTLDVICDTAMGINLNAQGNQGKDYVEAVGRVSYISVERIVRFWLFNPILFNLSSYGRKFKKYLNILHDFTTKIIQERKKHYKTKEKNFENDDVDDDGLGKKKIAFLDSMIEMDLKYPNSFTDSDIREEVDTFMFEGHDTTSAALTFAIFLLGNHQDIQEKAYQEQFDIFGYSDCEVTLKDLQRMNYLDKIIKETLRLYPSVPYISRMLTQDMKLEGVTIPKGVNIVILPYLVHRNSKYFPNPDIFDPERFASDLSAKRHPYAYIPFSAGPRNCIGQKFATMELKVALSTLIRFTKMETISKAKDFNLTPLLVLRTDKPIIVRVIKREIN